MAYLLVTVARLPMSVACFLVAATCHPVIVACLAGVPHLVDMTCFEVGLGHLEVSPESPEVGRVSAEVGLVSVEVGLVSVEVVVMSLEVGVAHSEGPAHLEDMVLLEAGEAKLAGGTAQFVMGMTRLAVGMRKLAVDSARLAVGMAGLAGGMARLVVDKAHLAVGMARVPFDCCCYHYCFLGRGNEHLMIAGGWPRSRGHL